MIQLKRAYEPRAKQDGKRFLVDRVWPRGVKKEDLDLDGWSKEVAPSTDLRKWFGHREERWEEFRERYFRELDGMEDSWKPLAKAAREGKITLVYGARNDKFNNAVALRDYLEAKG